MRYAAIFIGIICCCVATTAGAETLVRTGGQFELPNNQSIEGNFLAVGTPVSLSGEVTEDAVLVGNKVTVTGTIDHDLLAVSILGRLDGIVRDDARIVGGTVTVSGEVEGDLLVIADSVELLSGSKVGGDVLLYARSAVVAGDIGGTIKGSTRHLQVNSAVGGAIDVYTNQLDLGATASVTESVRYTSNNLLTQSVDTIVGGSVSRNDPVFGGNQNTLQSVAFPFLMMLFGTLLWLFLSKKTLNTVMQQTISHVPRSAVTGMVALLVLPLIIFVLFLSLLGSYVAILGLFGYITLLLLTAAAVPAVVGYGCLKLSNLSVTTVSPLMITIGSVVCAVLFLLPRIGLLVLLFICVIVFGGLIESIVRSSR